MQLTRLAGKPSGSSVLVSFDGLQSSGCHLNAANEANGGKKNALTQGLASDIEGADHLPYEDLLRIAEQKSRR